MAADEQPVAVSDGPDHEAPAGSTAVGSTAVGSTAVGSTAVGSTAVGEPTDEARVGAGGRVLQLVQSLPDLLVLLVASAMLVCGVLITLGRLHAGGVVVGAVLLTLVLAVVLRRYAPLPGRWDAAASVLALLGAGGWLLLNLPYASEQVFINRDPSVFTLLAEWLVDHDAPVIDTAPGSWGGPGFGAGEDGLLRSQNSHSVPAFAAVAGRLLGPGAVLQANLVIGAAVLLGCFTVARRWVASGWALLLPVTLGLGLPFLVVTRGLYTEPSGTLFMLAALTVLSAAARRPGPGAVAVVGLLAGGAGMVRIDGLLVCAALLPVLAMLLVRRPGVQDRTVGARGRVAAAHLLLFVGVAAVPVTIGVADLLLWSTPEYLLVYTGTLQTGVGLFVGTALVTLLVLLVLGPLGRTGLGRAGARLLRAEGPWRWPPAVLGTGVLAVAVSAPLWYQGRNFADPGNAYGSFVAGLQEQLGLPVDRARSYDEYALVSLTWYHGWVAVALGGAGLVLMLLAGLRHRPEWLLAPVVVLPLIALLLYDLEITPDQVWATRRLVIVVVPLLLLAAVWLLDQLWREGLPAKVVALLGGAALVAVPLSTLPGVVRAPQELGAVAFAEQLCEAVGERPVVVVGSAQTLAPTLGIRCGSDVELVPTVTSADTRDLVARHGRDLVLVTSDLASIEWASDGSGPPEPTIDVRVPEWERQLLQAPEGLRERRLAIWLGEPRSGRPVQPAPPLPDPR